MRPRAGLPGPLQADRCSRHSPAGSIAAPGCITVGRRSSGAPAVHRRAPLRRRQQHPGRQGCRDVLPPFTGGGPIAATARTGCSPALYRSAPAVQRRAPLRQHHAGGPPRPSRTLCSRRLPPGSIAAGPLHPCPYPSRSVPPPFNGGPHCGIYLREKKVFEPTSAPHVRGGAPLRLERAGRKPATLVLCSRRSPAGSIAATGNPKRPTKPGGCSRRSTAGPIVAIRGRFSCGPIRAPAPAVHPAGSIAA